MAVSGMARLSVLELLVAVALTAPGLALTRTLTAFQGFESAVSINQEYAPAGGKSGWHLASVGDIFSAAGQPLDRRPSYWLTHIPYWSGPCLATWSLIALGLIVRGSRREARPVFGSPGSLVGPAVILALAVIVADCVQSWTSFTPPMFQWRYAWPAYWTYLWIMMAGRVGTYLAVAWLTLAVTGRWSMGSGRRETLARAVGWCWIVLGLLSYLGVWCFARNL